MWLMRVPEREKIVAGKTKKPNRKRWVLKLRKGRCGVHPRYSRSRLSNVVA